MQQVKYYWVCPKCGGNYETPQPIPSTCKHYICPACYYKQDKSNSQMNQCAPVIHNERKERLWD